MYFVKNAVYEVILRLNDAMQKLKESSDPKALKREIANLEGRTSEELLALIKPEHIILNLRGATKEAVITELVNLLDNEEGLEDRDLVLHDVLEREKTMSTGMQHGIALPHAKTDGVKDLMVAVGVKKAGIDFDSLDGEKSRLFIMVVSPKKVSGPHVQFLAAIGSVLKDDIVREDVINADTTVLAATLLQKGNQR
jgi:fructose-specific phosphotransferase system IIA component